MSDIKVHFASASDVCNELNSTIARLETPEHLVAAQTAIVEANADTAWTALYKVSPAITELYEPCFSSLNYSEMKQRLIWIDGGDQVVSHLPWDLEAWKMQRCSYVGLGIYKSGYSTVLQDFYSSSRNYALCSSKQFLKTIFLLVLHIYRFNKIPHTAGLDAQ